MMAGDYYPDFYLRKRQREIAYRRVSISIGVIVFIVIGGLTGFMLYKQYLEPQRRQPVDPTQLAEEREDLTTQTALADGSNSGLPLPEETASPVATPGTAAAGATGTTPGTAMTAEYLQSLPYGQSFPLVQVAVGSSTKPASLPVTDEQAAADAAAAEAAAQEAATPADAAQTPATDAQDKPAETKPADKPAETKPAEDKPKEDKPAETKPAEDKPATPPAQTTSGSAVFNVYSGSYDSKDKAEAAVSQLSALGYRASVVALEPDFLVKVATLENYDEASALRQKLADSGFGTAFATKSRK